MKRYRKEKEKGSERSILKENSILVISKELVTGTLTTQKHIAYADKKLIVSRDLKFLNHFESQLGQHDFICSDTLDKVATETIIDVQKKPSGSDDAEKHETQ